MHILSHRLIPVSLALILCVFSNTVVSQDLNGFNIDDALIPIDEIMQGGPPKDGIPSLDNPQFVSANRAKELSDEDPVLGVVVGGIAKAYPIRILNWHEVVNDSIGKESIVVTYCPLCGSGVVFHSQINGKRLSFGVSGLLYNSDVLLYDRETLSLWSQLRSAAVTGHYKGQVLLPLVSQHTSWKGWRSQYPETLVLDFNTGYQRNYTRNPYAGYDKSDQLYFPVKFRAQGLHPKEKVIAIELNGSARAWPFVELRKTNGVVIDVLGGVTLRVEFDVKNNAAKIINEKGIPLAGVTLFWFAWSGFYPHTEVYRFVK